MIYFLSNIDLFLYSGIIYLLEQTNRQGDKMVWFVLDYGTTLKIFTNEESALCYAAMIFEGEPYGL